MSLEEGFMEEASYYLDNRKYTLSCESSSYPYFCFTISPEDGTSRTISIRVVEHKCIANTIFLALDIQGRVRLLTLQKTQNSYDISSTLFHESISIFFDKENIVPATLLSPFEDKKVSEKFLNHLEKNNVIESPLAGKVVRVLINEGQHVRKGTPLAVIESMKMENELCAPYDAIIKKLLIATGDVVKTKQEIMEFCHEKGDKNAAAKNWHGEAKV